VASSAFRTAVESKDIEAAIRALAQDVVFRSPVVFRQYEGREAVGGVLRAVFQVFEDFVYVDEVVAPGREVLLFEARVGDRTVQGVDLIRLTDDGSVGELVVMVRPMSGLLALAEAMGERLSTQSA
jgi:limonene-1,2-epoxide hydrolase